MSTDLQNNAPQNYADDDDDNQQFVNQDGGNYDDDDEQQQDGYTSENGGPDNPKYIRLRGLPWSATHQEILNFLKSVTVIDQARGIHLVTSRWDGKNTGEAYVEVQSQQDVDQALKLNKAVMGHRYIEVFTATSKEATEAMRKTSNHGNSFVVKLRGLPYAVTEQQIEEFFNGLEIKPDREGILFVMDRRGRATGEAFVQFESQEDTEQALGRNREKIGHRYIEIFRSSLAELKRASNGGGRPGPYDLKERGANRGGGSDYGGGRNNNMRGNDWGNGFGVGANNTLGFNNLPGFTNSGNFGNGYGSNNNGNNGNFGNNGGGNFGGNNDNNGGGFGNNGGGFGNNGGGFGNNRFNNGGGNFGNDFGDFSNFGNGNNRGGGGGGGGGGGMNDYGNNNNNFGNSGGNSGNMGFNGGGNFGPIGGGRGDNDYFIVHMRGLPYNSYENEVFKFFEPLVPANVRINFNKKGLHSGTADAFFETYEEAQKAMGRNKDQMGSRYIELFFDGKTKGNEDNVYGGGNNNNFSRRF